MLRVEPRAEVIAELAEGESFTTTPVAKSVVGADGEVALRIANTADLERYASQDKTVTFELNSIDGGELAKYSFSRTLAEVGASAGPVLVDSLIKSTDTKAVAEAAKTPETASILAVEAPDAPEELVDPSDEVQKTQTCGATLRDTYPGTKVAVGALYLKSTGTTGKLTYTRGSKSELGVGISVSGTKGSFTAQGSRETTASDSITFGALNGVGAQHLKATFEYGRYREWCNDRFSTTPVESDYYAYTTRVRSFEGGSSRTSVSMASATQCTTLGAGDSYTKDLTTAWNFSGGADISAFIGIDLSSRTGYTTSTSTTWTNKSGSSKNFCGVNGKPGQTPGLIVLG